MQAEIWGKKKCFNLFKLYLRAACIIYACNKPIQLQILKSYVHICITNFTS